MDRDSVIAAANEAAEGTGRVQIVLRAAGHYRIVGLGEGVNLGLPHVTVEHVATPTGTYSARNGTATRRKRRGAQC
jgi:hypothetical protein